MRQSMKKTETLAGLQGKLLEMDIGDTLSVSGVGSFFKKARPERPGRNPATGENITIAAKNVVTFKPSPSLIKEIN